SEVSVSRRITTRHRCFSPMRATARLLVIAIGVVSLSLTAYARFAPLDAPESRGAVPGTVVLDAHGSVLERDMSAGVRIPTTIDRVAPRMLQATISAEDRRFLQHVGVEAAARVYFGIGAANLDLAHAAYLAGLPQRPSEYDSVIDSAARVRQTYVLSRMVEDGWITRPQADAAAAERIDILPASLPPIAHQFVAFARAELARLRPDLAARDGLVIETTLDAGLQSESERLVRLRLETLRDR